MIQSPTNTIAVNSLVDCNNDALYVRMYNTVYRQFVNELYICQNSITCRFMLPIDYKTTSRNKWDAVRHWFTILLKHKLMPDVMQSRLIRSTLFYLCLFNQRYKNRCNQPIKLTSYIAISIYLMALLEAKSKKWFVESSGFHNRKY